MPSPPLDRAAAEAILDKACRRADLDPVDAELVRLGSAAVFRLRHQPVIVRVGRDGDRLPAARREVQVARWLAREGLPASRALNVDQPLVVDGHITTFWESASEQAVYGSTSDLARLLRALHALDPPADPQLPDLDPFGKTRERIEAASTLTEVDRELLRARLDGLVEAHAGLTFDLPKGVIHGDASVGNVILDRNGKALLVDLDGVSIGPREWDLVLTAMYYDRFGWHTAEEYAAFVDVIGFDVRQWSGYEVLGDIRELLMVAWLAQTASDEAKTAELDRRISTLRSGGSRRGWAPF